MLIYCQPIKIKVEQKYNVLIKESESDIKVAEINYVAMV